MTQNQLVLALLRERGNLGVTPMLALERIGTFRLASRIFDLNCDGHLIINEGARVNGKSVARYVLIQPPVQLSLDEVAP